MKPLPVSVWLWTARIDEADDDAAHRDHERHVLDAEVEPRPQREDDREEGEQERSGDEDPPLAAEVVAVADERRAVEDVPQLAAEPGEAVLREIRRGDARIGDEPDHPVPRREEAEERVERAADVDVVAARSRHRRGEVGVDARHRQREQAGQDRRRHHAPADVERRDEQHHERDADADVLVVRVVDEDVEGGCLAPQPRRFAGEDLRGCSGFGGHTRFLLIL